jgi:hypothetical protein
MPRLTTMSGSALNGQFANYNEQGITSFNFCVRLHVRG